MRPAENMEKLIKKLRYKTSAQMHDRILGNVLQSLDKIEKQKSGVITPNIWRAIMKSPITKIAVAAAIIIAAFIGLHYFTGPVSVTSTVYADVAQRLQNARTLIYTVITTTPVEGMPQMEMEVAFKEPGYMRMTLPGGYISVVDWTQGKGLSIIPPRKQFIEMDMANLPDDAAQRQFDAIERLRTLPERADEVLGEREIDGRTVQGFRVNEEGAINTVWIDPKTRELVVVEIEFVNAPGMGATMADFRFNIDLNDSLFSLTPPDGYTRMAVQVDVSEVSENDLSEFLRLWSKWTKDGTFPPSLNPVELAKVGMEMEKKGEFDPSQTSEQEREQHTMQMTRGMMFLLKLSAESNWRYAGENVKYGEAETSIFWYRPEGSETYRVIYGDLSVKDVTQEDLPK